MPENGRTLAFICKCKLRVIMTDKGPDYFKALLLALYPCKQPFSVTVRHTRPKTRCGSYYIRRRLIIINDGWGDTKRCTEIAIHEYTHHLHYTEFGKKQRGQAPHGPEFWQIYGQLMSRAKTLGYYEDESVPVIALPKYWPEPSLRQIFKDSLQGIKEWLYAG